MLPCWKNELTDLENAIILDSTGILPKKNETAAELKLRCEKLRIFQQELAGKLKRHGSSEIAGALIVRREEQIPPAVIAEAVDETAGLYGFKLTWAAGFYLTEPMGFLWGGSSWFDPENAMAIYILRKAFKHRRKWYIYRRSELLAHEMCHLAHGAVGAEKFEEFFAYQGSVKPLRRYLGSCFIRSWDGLIFMLPSLLLLMAAIYNLFAAHEALPMWVFWLIALSGPGYLIIRNHFTRREYFRSEQNLMKIIEKESARKVLFRCTEDEIAKIAKLSSRNAIEEFVANQSDLRFQVIKQRFLEKEL